VRPGLVVFDCDGVLVDSEPISERVMVEFLAGLGEHLSAEQIRARYIGVSDKTMFADLRTRLGARLPEDAEARYAEALHRVLATELRPVPGAPEAVRAVQAAGIATCVASSGTHAKMALTLAVTGFKPLFGERVYSSSEVARGKPAPDIFLHAAARMGHAPGTCVVIEDSPNGVRAARAAGMRVLGLTRGDAALAATLAGLGAEPLAAMSEAADRIPGVA